jgi:thioredoxin 1
MKKIFVTLILFFCISVNAADKKSDFSTEIFEKAQASGKTIVINSYEIWCGTCVAQIKVLNQAKKDFNNVIFLSYEQGKNKDIAKKLNINFRTTIVVYKGSNEVSRIIGQTKKEVIYSTIREGI